MDAARTGLRVLVVEDDPLLLRLVVRALESTGFLVSACRDTASAREAAETESFEAAAVDINLPDGSGLDIINQVRDRNPAAGIVAITGHVDVDIAVRSMQAGADDFLTKPFEAGVLSHVLKKSTRARLEKTAAERAQAYRELAFMDALTGVPNRRFIDERLQEAIDRARETGEPLAVAFLDIDNFKLLNDFAGHDQGDMVLQAFADTLRREVPAPAVFGRFGGDEFVAVFPGMTADAAAAHALRVRAGLGKFAIRGSAFPIVATVSVGVAEWDGVASPRALVAEAERRMYVDKSMTAFSLRSASSKMFASSQWIERFRTLRGLVKAIDRRDAYTRFHSDHATSMAVEVGRRVGLSESDLMAISVAGPIHDLGKLVVPDEILRKPGRLTREERRSMEDHPTMGAIIAAAVTDLSDVVTVIRHHHERFDGNGYPAGLQGNETPVAVRLFTIADAFSAMTTDRPYRRALGLEEAIGEIRAGLGTQFDPDLGAAFIEAASDGMDVTALALGSG